MMSPLKWNMGKQEADSLHDVVTVPGAASWQRRFTYASSRMVDDELVDGKSIDVETWVSTEGGFIEACVENSKRFVCEELKDDDR